MAGLHEIIDDDEGEEEGEAEVDPNMVDGNQGLQGNGLENMAMEGLDEMGLNDNMQQEMDNFEDQLQGVGGGPGAGPDMGMERDDQGDEEDEEEMDIDLDNPDDVKIIEREFEKIYESDEQFRTSFGQEAFDLTPI